jgi:hypothetical protein
LRPLQYPRKDSNQNSLDPEKTRESENLDRPCTAAGTADSQIDAGLGDALKLLPSKCEDYLERIDKPVQWLEILAKMPPAKQAAELKRLQAKYQ